MSKKENEILNTKDILDDLVIMEMVEKRGKRDKGNRHTHEEVKVLLREKIERLKEIKKD